MGVLELYLLFMFSVGFWACYEVMRPAIMIMSQHDPSDVIVENKLIAYTVMFCFGVITAPLMVVIIMVPGFINRLILSLTLNRE